MIEMRGVGFGYRDKTVLKGIDLQLRRGELTAIVGPNGCGKTTLLRLMGRLSEPQSGELLLCSKPYSMYSRRNFAKNVALMPQTRTIPAMTVWEFVSHGRYPYLDFSQKLSQRDERAVALAMQKTETEAFAQRDLQQLSGGERQRAYLAFLLAQETPVALLDEPTTYLDIAAQYSVMRILGKMRDDGKCVTAVLHDLPLAMEFCDRVIVMNNGRICADGMPCELAQSDVWRTVFGVSCTEILCAGQKKYMFSPQKEDKKS